MRTRQIKPSFFDNESLGDLAPLVRILFLGLWSLADREGLLEDRPRRIKAKVFPYDELDVDEALADGTLDHLASVYDAADDRIRDGASHPGGRQGGLAAGVPGPDHQDIATPQSAT